MRKIFLLVISFILGTLTSCKTQPLSTEFPFIDSSETSTAEVKSIIQTPIPSLTLEPPRVLTICMGQEPTSLFYYADQTLAAQNIYQAIYDGPIDFINYKPVPVIFERIPSLDNGDVTLQPVSVLEGEEIVDDLGNLVLLEEGVRYRPSGCLSSECAVNYTGESSVMMDEVHVDYHLIPGLKWSDGMPLNAQDSVFSYRIAKEMFQPSSWNQLNFARSYIALDDRTVEWVGIPGFQGVRPATFFFTPLPEHIFGTLSIESLRSSELAARMPLGWGAYKINEWVQGDHITLDRNPLYFRASEGLPVYDHLVYRFVRNADQALKALDIGECDIVDPTVELDSTSKSLISMEEQGELSLAYFIGTSWEQISFDISPLSPQQIAFFGNPEVRRAFNMCIDRDALISKFEVPVDVLLDTYVPRNHPLALSGVENSKYSPEDANATLNSIGWIDHDNNPDTPRRATRVPGIPDGTDFVVTYLVPDDQNQIDVAERIAKMVSSCGIEIQVKALPWEQLLAVGPDGVVFGRKFDLAQFAWASTIEPPCMLYESDEIPGPYPDYLKGWGGGNATGFSNKRYDMACMKARNTLEGLPVYKEYHHTAQEIFAEEVPAIPLYLNFRIVAAKAGLCGLDREQYGSALFTNLEEFDDGEQCKE